MTERNRNLINHAALGRPLASHTDYAGPAAGVTVLAVDESLYGRAGLKADDYWQSAGMALLVKGYAYQAGLPAFEAVALKLNAMPGVRAFVAASLGPDKRFPHGDMLVLGNPADATVALFTGENRIPFFNRGHVMKTVLDQFELVGLPAPQLPAHVRHFGGWVSMDHRAAA